MRRLTRLSLSAHSSPSPRPASAATSHARQTRSYTPQGFPRPSTNTRPWQQQRRLAEVREVTDDPFAGAWFNSTAPHGAGSEVEPGSGKDHQAPDERTVKLGKTIRILHERLPNILVSPLPQEILSPSVTLRLFPSTHPHLPTVRGRLPYVAMLCSSPLAWGRVPIVGNVRIVVLSERMVKNGDEKLVVRWKTCEKHGGDDAQAPSSSSSSSSTSSSFNAAAQAIDNKDFVGLFIFEFDDQGRILNHTIELADVGSNWEPKTSRFISVTDWLLGRAWSKKAEDEAGLALGYAEIGLRHRERHERFTARRR